MKSLKYFAVFGALAILVIFPSRLLAATPSLNINSFNNNSVQISVTGDPNYPINLYYYPPSSSNVVSAGNIGSTNNSGYFSNTVSGNAYNISSGSSVYVMVNGQQSQTVSWPFVNGNNYNQISFSQNNISLNAGQGQQINIYGSGSYYLSDNSNPNTVSSYINGNIVNVYGNAPGSATITVCNSAGNSSCGYLYVNVYSGYNGGGNYNPYNNNNPIIYTQPTNYTPTYGTPSAGVYLSQVPSTGGGLNLKIVLFYLGLCMWSAFLTNLYLSHRKYKILLAEK